MRFRTPLLALTVLGLTACIAPEEAKPDDTIVMQSTYRWATGPATDATVDIQDADFWYVPEFIGESPTPGQNGVFVWTLLPPTDGRTIKVTLLRQCHVELEKGLHIQEADRLVGWFQDCFMDLSMGTLTIAYDGTRWVPVDTGGKFAFMYSPDL